MLPRKYSAIVFDLGQVLLPFDYNIFAEKINSYRLGLGDEFLVNYGRNYHIHRDFESGNLSEENFVAKMLELLEFRISGMTFRKYFSEIFSFNEDVISLLPILKNKYKLLLLSNTNSIHREYGWKDYDFLKYFDGLILSHEVGAVKPDEIIYLAVEKVSGFPSQEHIFIDDIPEYVKAAKNLGWDAIHFIGYDDLVDNFKNRGILD
jgi:putative hydrolase of the HAD superfamily